MNFAEISWISGMTITPVYVHTVWKLQIPPRVQMFLWLLSKNKTLISDNLAKRRELADLTCLFCNEIEMVDHLFFDCSVAKRLLHIVLNILKLPEVCNYEILASRSLANKRHTVNNIICAAVMWCLRKFRNDTCFQGRVWTSEKQVLVWTAEMLRKWLPMFKMEVGVQVEAVILQLEHQAGQPLELGWEGAWSSQTSSSGLLTTQALELDFTAATSSEPISAWDLRTYLLILSLYKSVMRLAFKVCYAGAHTLEVWTWMFLFALCVIKRGRPSCLKKSSNTKIETLTFTATPFPLIELPVKSFFFFKKKYT